MTIEQMRAKIREPYPYAGWQARVDRMPTRQVVAVYNSFKESGLFTKKAKKKREQADQYHQMTLWDWMFEQSKSMTKVCDEQSKDMAEACTEEAKKEGN